MLLSHTNASLPLSQINRLYPVCIIFFQVSYHPDGVGKGRKEFSSKTIALDRTGAVMPHPAVSLSLSLAALLLRSLQLAPPRCLSPLLALRAPLPKRRLFSQTLSHLRFQRCPELGRRQPPPCQVPQSSDPGSQ